MSCHFGTPVISFNTTFTKTNTPCENKQLHYQLGDLEKFRAKRVKYEVLHIFALPRN